MIFTGECHNMEEIRMEERVKDGLRFLRSLVPWLIILFLAIQLITARHAQFRAERNLRTLRNVFGQQAVGIALQRSARNLPGISNDKK